MNIKLSRTFKLIQNYRWNSLFFKYFRKLLLIIIIPILTLCFASYFYFYSQSTKDFNQYTNQSFTKSYSYINNMVNEINTTYLKMVQTPSFETFCEAPYSEIIQPAMYECLTSIRETINSTLNMSTYLDSIYLYSSKNNYVLSNRGGSIAENFYDTSWIKQYKSNQSHLYISVSDITLNNIKQSKISFCFVYKLSETVEEVIVFNILSNDLNSYINSGNNKTETLLLVNKDNTIVHSTTLSDIHSAYQDTFYQNGKYKIISQAIDDIDLTVYSITDTSQHRKSILVIQLMIIFIVIAGILLAFILSTYLALQFYNSISQIIYEIENPNLNNEETTNELEYIRSNIFNMVMNNKYFEQELVQKVQKLKKSQSIALQTQISPHFIFNTLGLVNVLIMNLTKGPSLAEKVITLLADLIKYVLNTKTYIVSVQEEVESAKKYIEIERIKHMNCFDVVWDIDENVLQLKTIKFILQPILENAIKHGVKHLKDKPGFIEITIKQKNNQLIFTISNNGPKIPEKTLKQIQDELKSDELPENSHIGLINTNLRIKLIYGDSYGCCIESTATSTVVTIVVNTEIN